MGKRTVTFLMIAAVAIIMLFILCFINRSTIFQEGNPVPVFKGVYHLVINNQPYVKINDDPVKWITKAGKHDELFSYIEKTYNVKVKDQTSSNEGSGGAGKSILYTFEGNGKTVTLVCRWYSSSFRVWELSGH